MTFIFEYSCKFLTKLSQMVGLKPQTWSYTDQIFKISIGPSKSDCLLYFGDCLVLLCPDAFEERFSCFTVSLLVLEEKK